MFLDAQYGLDLQHYYSYSGGVVTVACATPLTIEPKSDDLSSKLQET